MNYVLLTNKNSVSNLKNCINSHEPLKRPIDKKHTQLAARNS